MSHEDADKRAAEEAWESYKESREPKGGHTFYYKDNGEYWKEGFVIGRQSLAAKVEALEKIADIAADLMNPNHPADHEEIEGALQDALAALKSLEGKEGEKR